MARSTVNQSVDLILQAAQTLSGAIHEAESRSERLEKEVAELRLSIQETKNDEAIHRERLKKMDLENRELKDQVERLQADTGRKNQDWVRQNTEAQGQIRQLEEREKVLKSESLRLAQALQVAQADAVQGREAVARLKRAEVEAAQAKAQANDLEREKAQNAHKESALMHELKQLKAAHAQMLDGQSQWRTEWDRLKARAQSALAETVQLKKDLEQAQKEKRQIDQEVARIEESMKLRFEAQATQEVERLEREAKERLLLAKREEAERIKREQALHYDQFLRQERVRWGQIVQERDREIQQLKSLLRNGPTVSSH